MVGIRIQGRSVAVSSGSEHINLIKGEENRGMMIANRIKGQHRSVKIALPLICALFLGMCLTGGMLLPGTAEATVAITSCGDCHGNPPTDSATRDSATGSFPGSHNRHAASPMNLACAVCHVNPNWTSFSHQNGSIQTRVPINGQWGTYSKGASFAQVNTVNFGTCNGVYCHSTVQTDGGQTAGVTYASPRWGSSGTVPCGSCHAVPNTTGKHSKHEAWASSSMAVWTTNSCRMCHSGAGDETVLHARGTINMAIGTTYYGITTASYSQGNNAPNNGYGSCSAVYCHGGWATSGGSAMTPNWTTTGGAAMACGSCHAASPATPPSTGSHRTHAGNWSTAVGLACTSCHGATAGSSTHVNLSVQWAFNQGDARISTIARYKGAIIGSTGAKAGAGGYGNCSNIYCHSNVQANGGLAGPTSWATPVWGNAASGACGTCHAMPNTSGGHTAHSRVYGTTAAACQTCHNGAGDGTVYHARGTINMRINTTYWGITTALYSQGEHKGAGGGYGSCSATTCHGGTTKIWSSVNTANHQCTKCHGNPWATTSYALYKAAPGADATGKDLSGALGTLSGGVSNDPQVGAHDTHLRGLNTIALPVACNNCHTVPATVTAAGHNNTAGPAELVWSGLANTNGAIPSWTPASTTCSTVYCHGGAMPRGDTSGANRVPAWTTGGYLRNVVWQTNSISGCGTCHGAPPTAGSSASSHTGKVFPADCNGCHPHMAANGSFTTISLHMDGILQAAGGDCLGCHNSQKAKSKGVISTIRQIVGTGGDFNMGAAPTGSRHLFGATTILKWDCTVCHREGNLADAATNTNHNDASGLVHLRNVDTINEAVGWSINNKSWNTTDYASLDQFCVSCHDANGSSAVAVNATNNGLLTGPSAWGSLRAGWKSMGGTFVGRAAMSPFNSTDWRSGYNAASTSNAAAGEGRAKMINVKDQFNPTNPSQHAVLGQRYNTTWTSWTAAAWSSYYMKKSRANINVMRETALLSCADCHVLDAGSGAHGGVRKYNMWSSTINDGICIRCHAAATYQNGGGAPESRFSHNYTRSGTTGYGLPQGAVTNPANCMMCHASYDSMSTVGRQNSYGGIHGSWTSQSGAGSTVAGYRFFPGTWRRQAMTTTAYSGTTAGSCYFPGATSDGFSNCTSHTGTATTAVTTPSYGRPVNY